MPIVLIISSKPEVHLDEFLEFYISKRIIFVVLYATAKHSYYAMQATLDNVIEFLEETKKRQKSDEDRKATCQYIIGYLRTE